MAISDFEHAPEPRVVNGLNSVPIHIDSVNATIVFDVATQTTQCTALMQFTVGPDAGCPQFDLRQTIISATLDGNPIVPGAMAHHNVGGGPGADIRVLAVSLASGTSHTLALTYALQLPNANAARDVIWLDAERLSFSFHLSDLNPGRYMESWLPANLVWDAYPMTLDIQIVGTAQPHVPWTNGTITHLDPNHWQIAFPSHFTPCSPMLLLEAADQVTTQVHTVSLGGSLVHIELMKPAGATLSLPTQASEIASNLASLHTNIGPYKHGNRFVAYLSTTTHAMEYDGATTTRLNDTLRHEVFHSWWARGVVPATAEDGWLDEAWTTYNTQSPGPDAIPTDLSGPPLQLWANNPYRRRTHGSAYSAGANVFSAIAAEVGVSNLQTYMSIIYKESGRRFTTPHVEAELIRLSGKLTIADLFTRYVYGFDDLSGASAPDLFFRDNTDDDGLGSSSGTFWRSPDVWIRNTDDDGATHQSPELGQDNWIYARVHNRGTAESRSFVVGFKIQTWAGTQFIYPGDWFPLTAATVGFELLPGESKVVKARWRAQDVPSEGTHGCLLAMVYDPDDGPASGYHVWDDPNLAQRNLKVVDLVPGDSTNIHFQVGSGFFGLAQAYQLEIVRPRSWPNMGVTLSHAQPGKLNQLLKVGNLIRAQPQTQPLVRLTAPTEIAIPGMNATISPAVGSTIDLGRFVRPLRPSRPPKETVRRDARTRFDIRHGLRVPVTIGLRARQREQLNLKITAPFTAKPGQQLPIDVVQRDARGRVVGGITIVLRITSGSDRIQ